MSQDDGSDVMLRMLARLPPVVPDAARTERVRHRCHALLTRKSERMRSTTDASAALLVRRVCAVGTSLYVIELAREMLRISRLPWPSP